MNPTRLTPACHHCGQTFPTACSCFVTPRPPLWRRLPARFSLATLLLLIALAACLLAWRIHVHRVALADDRKEFYTHEESVPYLEFLTAAQRSTTEAAEAKAAENGPDRPRWLAEAAASRIRHAALQGMLADDRHRLALKRLLRDGSW